MAVVVDNNNRFRCTCKRHLADEDYDDDDVDQLRSSSYTMDDVGDCDFDRRRQAVRVVVGNSESVVAVDNCC